MKVAVIDVVKLDLANERVFADVLRTLLVFIAGVETHQPSQRIVGLLRIVRRERIDNCSPVGVMARDAPGWVDPSKPNDYGQSIHRFSGLHEGMQVIGVGRQWVSEGWECESLCGYLAQNRPCFYANGFR